MRAKGRGITFRMEGLISERQITRKWGPVRLELLREKGKIPEAFPLKWEKGPFKV